MNNKLIKFLTPVILCVALVGCSAASDKQTEVEQPKSINEQAISFIKEEKYLDAINLINDDFTSKYGNWENLNIGSLSEEKQREYNLLLYSLALDSENDQYYLPALKNYKELKPIDGVITQEEIDSKIADLTPKAEEAKAEQSIPSDVRIGMTKDEVLASTWGKPKDINKTKTATLTREQWVYSGNRYLYFENGVLTTIQD